MSVGIANNSKAGLCPHGLPPSACPICSGGGGGMKMDRNTRRNAGELTWNECYAIGQMMKAAQARKEAAQVYQQNVAIQNALIQAGASRFARMFNLIGTFLANSPVGKVVSFGVNVIQSTAAKAATVIFNTFNGIVNAINGAVNFVQNAFNTVKNIVVDISDKIAAFFGEEKLAKFKNVGEFIERAKKKVLSLFGLIDETNREEETPEEVKIEEKRISSLEHLRRKLNLLKEDEAQS